MQPFLTTLKVFTLIFSLSYSNVFADTWSELQSCYNGLGGATMGPSIQSGASTRISLMCKSAMGPDFVCGYCTITNGNTRPKPHVPEESRGAGMVCGSIVNVDQLAVGESVKVAGTNEKLTYFTNRTWARTGDYSVSIPLTGNPANGLISGITVVVEVAGQVLNYPYTTVTNDMVFNFTWDGLDGSSNVVYGGAIAKITVTYANSIYNLPMIMNVPLGRYKALEQVGLGGWTISSVHFYDSNVQRLYLGSGESIDSDAFRINIDGSGNVSSSGTGSYYMAVLRDKLEAYIFDLNGRHLQTRSTRTNVVVKTMSYNGSGQLTDITDAYSKTIAITRPSGSLIEITAPYGQLTSLSLDGSGRVETITDPMNHDHEITYDATTGLMATFEKPSGAVNTFSYNSDGTLQQDAHSAGAGWGLSKSFSVAGTTTTTTTTLTSAVGLVSNQVVTTNPTGYTRVENEPNGTQWTFGYNPASQSYTYYPGGRFYQEGYTSDPRFGTMGFRKSSAYLAASTNTETTSVSLSNSYSSSNLLTLTSDSENTVINTKTWNRAYSNSTKKDTFTSPVGRVSKVEYNSNNKIVGFELASYAPVVFGYDADGRLETITKSSRVTTLDYDADGFIQSVQNPESQTSSFTYDDNGNVLTQTLPDSRVVTYTYDNNGNLASVLTAASKSHSIVSNLYDLIASYTAPILGMTNYVTTYTYDDDKRLTLVTKPDNSTIGLTYGTSGNSKGLVQTMATTEGNYGYTYDAYSKLTQLTSPQSVTNSFAYIVDLPTDTTTATGAFTAKVGHTWSNFRKATNKITDNSAATSTVSFSYDNDRIMSAAGDLSITRSTTSGFVTQTTLGNVTEHFTYDGTYGEISEYQVKYSGTEIYKEQYTRDLLARITSKTVVENGSTTTVYDYVYDTSGRLHEVYVNTTLTRTYNYDNNSNRSSLVAGSTTSGTYDDQDRILTYGGNTYTHTTNGFLSQVTDGTNTINYLYDSLGGLIEAEVITSGGTDTYTYLNDALGRRVERKKNGTVEKRFIYDESGRLSAELDGSGNLVSHFIYATMSHVPDYMIRSSVKYKLVHDQLGSVVSVVNTATGAVASSLAYDEFGRVVSSSTPEFQPFGFAGGINDLPSKLTRFGARDYDPETGRWTSKDPILFNGPGTNLYGYTLQDPINYIDPSGNIPIVAIPAIGAAVGVGAYLVGTYLGGGTPTLGGALAGAVGGAAATLGAGAATAAAAAGGVCGGSLAGGVAAQTLSLISGQIISIGLSTPP